MVQGKYLSLEEARKLGKLKEFVKEHPSESDGRFAPLLEAMSQGRLEAARTSDRATSAGYSGTRTRQGTSEDALG